MDDEKKLTGTDLTEEEARWVLTWWDKLTEPQRHAAIDAARKAK